MLSQMLPFFEDERLIYVADRAHAPYGTRTLAEVQNLSHQIAEMLVSQGATTIVVACNTASAGALASLRADLPDTNFVGMEPAVKPAAAATKSGVVGVLATEVTFQGELYASLVDQFAADLTIVTRAAPEWVSLVEKGIVDGPDVEELVGHHLCPLLDEGADTLVLGCTHFPFLTQVLQRVAGQDVTIIDPAPAVARQAARVHTGPRSLPGLEARVSGDIDEFIMLSHRLANITFSGAVLPWEANDPL